MYNFECVEMHCPDIPGDLAIEERDIVWVETTSNWQCTDGTAYGYNVRTGRRGLFPSRCVKFIKRDAKPEPPPGPVMPEFPDEPGKDVLLITIIIF